ncbi:MAG TPA: hypothetical protein VGD89_01220 [Flavipsychrobacter sp.]
MQKTKGGNNIVADDGNKACLYPVVFFQRFILLPYFPGFFINQLRKCFLVSSQAFGTAM